MAFTPSASAVKAAVFPVPPPSAVARPLVSVVARARRAPVQAAALNGNARRWWRPPRSTTCARPSTPTSAPTSSPRSSPLTRYTTSSPPPPHKPARSRMNSESRSVGMHMQMSPAARLTDVMSRPVQVATPGQRLAEVDAFFFATQQYSGLPVVDEEGRCIGVISNKDKAKAPNGMESTVGEVMSSPAITLTLYKTVLEAAALMLKNKVHRIPVVNEQRHVIGIVTRSDVFQAPEPNKA